MQHTIKIKARTGGGGKGRHPRMYEACQEISRVKTVLSCAGKETVTFNL